MRVNKEVRIRTLELFSSGRESSGLPPAGGWPPASRFPLNIDPYNVAGVVQRDLMEGTERLIVAGYAGLDQIINFLGDCDTSDNPIRVLLGWEPFASRQESYELDGFDFPKAVESYWLENGISLRLSAKLVRCIQKIESNQIDTRYLGRSGKKLHAKIYVTSRAATVGSSNFTKPGLFSQLEANSRFTAAEEPVRHQELVSIAENYWTGGKPYNTRLLDLLKLLLRPVEWKEALARSCAELLEGEWAKAYLERQSMPTDGALWPSQRQGIAQALYVLTRQGSVLIADAAGSGKTRMGANLVGAVGDHNIRNGRLRHGKSVMICPPLVEEAWARESNRAGVSLDIISHGLLSHEKAKRHQTILDTLRRAQVLSIDEGHNFLAVNSARTRHVLRNMADYVLIFTATPLNRSVVDLLRIADILGADNLDPSTVKMFHKLLSSRQPLRILDRSETEALRKEVRKFTVRRTRSLLDQLISRTPEAYKDADGNPCRYPTHVAETYRLNELTKDRQLAGEIRAFADKLLGVAAFQKPIEKPRSRHDFTDQQFLDGRLSSAKKLVKYAVMKALRSSRAALVEHILGTKRALADFEIKECPKSSFTGDIVGKLKRLEGATPKNLLSVPLPDWLSDRDAHAEACRHDANLYSQIHDLVTQMSDQRVHEKADLCVRLARERSLVLAFDSRPITLAFIRQRIQDFAKDLKVVIATGDAKSDRAEALKMFGRGSVSRNVVGLCSDSLSEGVNLQQAAALIHLDMPSVVRIAEQRVGRIDRLDSPHDAITAYWPDDAEEFALSSDERFIERHEAVETLLGANLVLPEEMIRESRPLSAREVIDSISEEARKGSWDGIQDAFEPVRAMIYGSSALVDEPVYEHYKKVSARLRCGVGVVNSQTSWAFFCLSGGDFGAPRWVFMGSPDAPPQVDLEGICGSLRERLTPETKNLTLDDVATKLLDKFVVRLAYAERELLPRKKRRAIEELEHFLESAMHTVCDDHECLNKIRLLHAALRQPGPELQPDLDEIAVCWLDIIRPVWFERLKQRRKRPLLLKDIRPYVLEKMNTLLPVVLERFSRIPILRAPDERVAACILGIPGELTA